jgi:MscS family membrane protein
LSAVVFYWYVFNIVSTVELILKKFIAKHDTPLTEQILPIVRKTLRIFVAIIGLLFIMQDVFGRDIGSWLAGLGIAGLAVSLAAQDSLKNFFGSITLLLDRPYVVGQWIAYQGYSGTVEEIGFRSTRLRLFDGTLVTIPNSDIVNNSVQNYSLRPFTRRLLNVTVPYDTSLEKMRLAVQIIKDILDSPEFRENVHDPADPKFYAPRVHFTEFNAASLNIQVYYYYRPPSDWLAYLAYNERFNLALMEAYEKAGIEFSFPTQTLYLAGDPKRKLPLFVNSEAEAKNDS